MAEIFTCTDDTRDTFAVFSVDSDLIAVVKGEDSNFVRGAVSVSEVDGRRLLAALQQHYASQEEAMPDQPLRMTTNQPDWVLDLVAAAEWLEYTHPKIAVGDRCLSEELAAVPADVREAAKGWAQAKQSAARAEENSDAA